MEAKPISIITDEMLLEIAKRKSIEMAFKMLKDDMPIEKVAEYCGLPVNEVEEIKRSGRIIRLTIERI